MTISLSVWSGPKRGAMKPIPAANTSRGHAGSNTATRSAATAGDSATARRRLRRAAAPPYRDTRSDGREHANSHRRFQADNGQEGELLPAKRLPPYPSRPRYMQPQIVPPKRAEPPLRPPIAAGKIAPKKSAGSSVPIAMATNCAKICRPKELRINGKKCANKYQISWKTIIPESHRQCKYELQSGKPSLVSFHRCLCMRP